MSDLQELKKEADDLGVSYPSNITAVRLQEKIEEFYQAKEAAAPKLAVVEEPKKEEEETPKELSKEELFHATRIKREKAAKEIVRVSIVDNDQRVNNHTTTCTVNCSNEYFDLGTRILPLNENIEVSMGHLRTLIRVKIPLHVRDNKSGLSSVRLRPRYTISYLQ